MESIIVKSNPTLTDIIKQLGALYRCAQEEDKSIITASGGQPGVIEFGSSATANILFADRPQKDNLRQFLTNLPEEYLTSLVVLYYIGRDEDDGIDPVEYYKDLRKTTFVLSNKDALVQTLMEKLNVTDHVNQGIAFSSSHRFINSLPQLIAAQRPTTNSDIS